MIIWWHHRTVVRNKWDNELKHLAWCWEHNEASVNVNYFNLKRLLKGKIKAKNIIVKYCFISLYFSLGREIIFKEIGIEYIDRFSWKVTLFIKPKEFKIYKIFLLWKHQTMKASSDCLTSISIRKNCKCPIVGTMKGMNLPVPKEVN